MVLRKMAKFTWRNGQPRLAYGCSRFAECRSTHGAHPDGKPLGDPADSEAKIMRMAAHRTAEIAFGKRETKERLHTEARDGNIVPARADYQG